MIEFITKKMIFGELCNCPDFVSDRIKMAEVDSVMIGGVAKVHEAIIKGQPGATKLELLQIYFRHEVLGDVFFEIMIDIFDRFAEQGTSSTASIIATIQKHETSKLSDATAHKKLRRRVRSELPFELRSNKSTSSSSFLECVHQAMSCFVLIKHGGESYRAGAHALAIVKALGMRTEGGDPNVEYQWLLDNITDRYEAAGLD